MDPASAVIGIVSFGFEVFGKINEVRKAFKGAPDDLQSLEDSCFLVELSLGQLRAISLTSGSPRFDTERLEKLCERAQRHLKDVEMIVDKVTVKGVTQGSRARERPIRKIKWLMNMDNLNDITHRLKELQMTLTLIVLMIQSVSHRPYTPADPPTTVNIQSLNSSVNTNDQCINSSLSYPSLGALRCPLDCACRCHHPSAVHLVPSWLAPYVGQVSLSKRLLHPTFSSWSLCNIPICRGNLHRAITLQWLSPWRLVHGYLQYTAGDRRIHFSIGTPRVVPWDSPVMEAVLYGDFRAVCDLFATGRASVWDYTMHGWTVFQCACRCWLDDPNDENLKIIQLFIEAGADALLFEESQPFYSAHDTLAVGLFGFLLDNASDRSRTFATRVRTSPAAISAFRSLLNIDPMDVVEDYLNRHRAQHIDVGGLLASLEHTRYSAGSQSFIFEVIGFTALTYAIEFSPQSVLSLLEDGEDAAEEATLACAVENGRCTLIKPLLDAGADVNMKDAWGYTPLHQACARCWYDDLFELIRWAEGDIDWNACTPDGQNALDLFDLAVSMGWATNLSQSQIDEFRAALVAHTYSAGYEHDVRGYGQQSMPGAFPDAL